MKKPRPNFRYSVSLLSLFLLTGLLPATSPPRSLITGSEQTLLVGSDYDYPPYEFNHAGGEPTGFNVRLIRAVADAVGLRTDIRLGVWNEVRDQLENGKIDVIAGMYFSKEREKSVDFSVSHNMVSSALFVRRDSPIETFEQSREKEIIVQKGDIMHDYLVEHGFTTHIVTVVRPHQKAIIVSGFAETERVKKTQSLGAGAYVKKPYGLEKLGLAVKKELEQQG